MTLQDYWNKKELVGGEIIFADGRTIFLEENWCRKRYGVSETSTLKEEEEKYEIEGTSFDVIGQAVHPKTGHIAYRGWGSMGNEGFVAYANENGQLFWLLFLDFSNPFFEVYFEDENIVAVTELKYTFRIPFDEPEKLSCVPFHSWDKERIEECEKKKKRGYNDVEVWNVALDLSMEWGENCLSPIEKRLLKRYPKLEKIETERCEGMAKNATKRALKIVNELAKKDGLNVSYDEFKSIHQTEQTWIDEKNMSQMFNQAMYYSMK